MGMSMLSPEVMANVVNSTWENTGMMRYDANSLSNPSEAGVLKEKERYHRQAKHNPGHSSPQYWSITRLLSCLEHL